MKKMFNKKKFEKREAVEPDITSLLDILVIMLFFLLHIYNASDLSIDLVPGLDLAGSSTTDLGHQAIVIQVDKDNKVFIDNKLVENTSFSDEKVEALYQKLKEIEPVKENERTIASSDEPQKPNHRPVNIVLDEEAPYMIMQKVMHTVSLAGYDEIKLIVGVKSEG